MGWDGHVLTDSRRLPGVLARAQGRRRRGDVPLDLRREHGTTSAPRRGGASRRSSAPTSRWCSTCARRCPAPTEVVRDAVDRTARWAERAAPRSPPVRPPGPTGRGQAQFGIVQGGVDVALRVESARRTVDARLRRLRASAGCRWGRRRAEMLPAPSPRPSPSSRPTSPATSWASAIRSSLVEADRPRRRHVRLRAAHPPGPPRHRPHRRRAAEPAQRPVRDRRPARSTRPARARCAPAGRGATCATCCQVGEPTAARLLTIHNVSWTSSPRGPHGRRDPGRSVRRRGGPRSWPSGAEGVAPRDGGGQAVRSRRPIPGLFPPASPGAACNTSSCRCSCWPCTSS